MAPGSATYASPSAGTLQQQIDAANNNLEKVVEQYNKITIQLQQSHTSQATMQTQLQTQQAAVDSAAADVGQLAAAAYMGGPMNSLNALLKAGSPSAFIDQLTRLDQAARARSKNLSAFRQARAKLQADKSKLDADVAAQQAQQVQLAAQKTQINSQLDHLNSLMAQAGVKNTGPTAPPRNVPYYPGQAGIAVKFAYSQIGAEYHWGQAGPYSTGYDCSGLTMAAWAKAGVSLPHNAAMQYNSMPHISRSQLKVGDLVFYNSLGHVAIYIGNNQVIHAPHTGTTVQIAGINIDPITGYGRPG
ncbi:MAG TPA: C40 family peptidase [Rugosimonospora sp.]|nr:C40 family peptidase [Rugosimonospora sp.]